MTTFESFEVSDLKSLPVDDVRQVLTRVATQVSELNPNIDVRRGVFRDLVLQFHAVLETAIRQNLDKYRQSSSLYEIAQNPDLADPVLVDRVLSNWGLYRKPGSQAFGPVVIELSSPVTTAIPEGFVFEARGFQYTTTATFIARPKATAVQTPNDRLLVQLSNGSWAFTVDVVASVASSESRLLADELVSPLRTIANFVTAYASETFKDGTDDQTTASLLLDLERGVAAKTMSNRVTMEAWLLSQEAFSGVSSQSVVGFGDPEMTRDVVLPVPISIGGKADWYVRTQPLLQVKTFTLTALCISKTLTDSTWNVFIPSDLFPGFYAAKEITPVSNTKTYQPITDISITRSSIPLGSNGPYLPNAEHVAFTAYQQALLTFVNTQDPTQDITVNDVATVAVTLEGLPLISEIQSAAGSRAFKPVASDLLVKAPVPCKVSVSFSIVKKPSAETPSVTNIISTVVSAINDIGFTGRIDSSLIIDRIHDYLDDTSGVTGFRMIATVLLPNGHTEVLSGTETLLVPKSLHPMVSPKTVQFFTDPTQVSVSVLALLEEDV